MGCGVARVRTQPGPLSCASGNHGVLRRAFCIEEPVVGRPGLRLDTPEAAKLIGLLAEGARASDPRMNANVGFSCGTCKAAPGVAGVLGCTAAHGLEYGHAFGIDVAAGRDAQAALDDGGQGR